MKHANNGNCPKCGEIFNRYPGFHKLLRAWFSAFQSRHPEAHISCAGRGRLDQEAAVINRTSRAHYGDSAHNYNAAIDLFEVTSGDPNIYRRDWFEQVLKPEIETWLNWYGAEGSQFYELPHVELRDWRELKTTGVLTLVEPIPETPKALVG